MVHGRDRDECRCIYSRGVRHETATLDSGDVNVCASGWCALSRKSDECRDELGGTVECIAVQDCPAGCTICDHVPGHDEEAKGRCK